MKLWQYQTSEEEVKEAHWKAQIFSYFDTGKGILGDEPERFCHGFVLGLLAELNGRYVITSKIYNYSFAFEGKKF